MCLIMLTTRKKITGLGLSLWNNGLALGSLIQCFKWVSDVDANVTEGPTNKRTRDFSFFPDILKNA